MLQNVCVTKEIMFLSGLLKDHWPSTTEVLAVRDTLLSITEVGVPQSEITGLPTLGFESRSG